MLINFLEEKVIIRNFFSKDKTVIFLLVRNDSISERTLEKLLTLYLKKCDIVNDENDFKKNAYFSIYKYSDAYLFYRQWVI